MDEPVKISITKGPYFEKIMGLIMLLLFILTIVLVHKGHRVLGVIAGWMFVCVLLAATWHRMPWAHPKMRECAHDGPQSGHWDQVHSLAKFTCRKCGRFVVRDLPKVL